jgi:hypothetical protein
MRDVATKEPFTPGNPAKLKAYLSRRSKTRGQITRRHQDPHMGLNRTDGKGCGRYDRFSEIGYAWGIGG